MGRAIVMLIAAIVLSGCASLAPPKPRFVTVFEQREDFCRIHVVQDTRTQACFIAFRCGWQPTVLQVEDDLCVP